MFTVPHPLCCTILSAAWYAPPPIIHDSSPDLSPLMVMASSQTSSNHTYSRVQWPVQLVILKLVKVTDSESRGVFQPLCCTYCTPSAWFLPIMTFFKVAPALRMKTASESPCEQSISHYSVISQVRNLPPSACSVHAPLPRSYLTHPASKVSPAAMVMALLIVLLEVAVGRPPVYPLQASADGRRARRLAIWIVEGIMNMN